MHAFIKPRLLLSVSFVTPTAPSGPGPSHCKGFPINIQLDKPKWVEIFWTSDRPVEGVDFGPWASLTFNLDLVTLKTMWLKTIYG